MNFLSWVAPLERRGIVATLAKENSVSTVQAFASANYALAKLYAVEKEQQILTAYVAERLRELKRGGMSQRAMAEKGGISAAQLSNVLDGTRRAGGKTARAVARILGTTWAKLEEDAAAWAAKRSASVVAFAAVPLRVRERTESDAASYPRLLEAIELRKGTALPITLERVIAIAMNWPADRSVGEWIDEIDRLDASFRADASLKAATQR